MTLQEKIVEFCDKHLGEYRIRNGQAVARYCPFCHGGDSGDIETFSVGLYNGAFSCLRGSCAQKGSFRELCERFGERYVTDGIRLPSQYARKVYARPESNQLLPITETCVQYIESRMISKDTIDAFRIASDTQGNIVFPFYRNDALVYVKYRKPKTHHKEDGPKEWQMANTEPILFHMDAISFNQPLVITEGEFDAMALYEAGVKNVVSVPCGCNNMDWVTNCWEWLEKFQQIILFGDSDEPGQEMIVNLMQRLGEDRCMTPQEYPEMIWQGKLIGRPCKDANEILFAYGADYLKELVDTCEPVPVEGILNLADITMIDPRSIPRIQTKIPALDNAIGGFAEGTLNVFSGRRGEGKSTIGGQFLLNAIQQGHSVCAYSGELTAQRFKDWIMLQATERKYIEAVSDPKTGKLYGVVPYAVQRRITEWLNNKFFLFDNNNSSTISTAEKILKIFTLCAKRNNTKLFLVDNLLTVLSDVPADGENKAQSSFVADLKKFAVKYKVAVILVNTMATCNSNVA